MKTLAGTLRVLFIQGEHGQCFGDAVFKLYTKEAKMKISFFDRKKEQPIHNIMCGYTVSKLYYLANLIAGKIK